MKPSIALCDVSLAMASCSTLQPNQVRVRIATEPPGAMIYWADKAYGLAPQTLTFTLSPEAMQRGWMEDSNVRALWPSGAEKRGLRILLQHRDGHVVFSRPPSVSGLDKDLAWALQLRQTAIAEGQAAAAFHQATQSSQPKTTNCTRIGNTMNCTTQ